MVLAELGTSLFQIAHLLTALERLLISGAKEQFNQMSDEQGANWQNPILSSCLMSDLRKKEQTKARSDLNFNAINLKLIQIVDNYVHIYGLQSKFQIYSIKIGA